MLIPERSAMSTRQKMSIFSNELVRWVFNVNVEKIEKEDIIRVVDHLTSQLKTSGYDRKQAREIDISRMSSWMK